MAFGRATVCCVSCAMFSLCLNVDLPIYFRCVILGYFKISLQRFIYRYRTVTISMSFVLAAHIRIHVVNFGIFGRQF